MLQRQILTNSYDFLSSILNRFRQVTYKQFTKIYSKTLFSQSLNSIKIHGKNRNLGHHHIASCKLDLPAACGVCGSKIREKVIFVTAGISELPVMSPNWLTITAIRGSKITFQWNCYVYRYIFLETFHWYSQPYQLRFKKYSYLWL